MYAGTSGNTHGDKNESSPANQASGSVRLDVSILSPHQRIRSDGTGMVQNWGYTFMAHSKLDRVLHQINGLKFVILRSKATKNLFLKAKNGMLRSAQHDKRFGVRKSANLFLPESETIPRYVIKMQPPQKPKRT